MLCSMCLPGYISGDRNKCTKCDYEIELYKMIGIFFLMIGFLVLIVKGTIKSAESDNTHSVMSKILMNHLQMLIITSSFDMKWPPMVQQLFIIALPIAELTTSLTAFDCWMDSRDPATIDPYNFKVDPGFLPVIYQKLFVMAGMPFLIGGVGYTVWWVVIRC